MKALKQKVPFKKVAKSFSEGHKLPDISEMTQKKTGPDKSKKLKVGAGTSASTSSETTSNEDNAEEAEDFHSSYVLTMSQMVPEKTDKKKSKDLDDSEYVFEPCTQVGKYSL